MASQTPVVAAAYRTPQGKEDGVFADVRGEDLAIALIEEILAETGLSGEQIDDMLWGCAQNREEQAGNVARTLSVISELGEEVPAATINRACASSAQAVMSASDAIKAGERDCMIVGGLEHMSKVKMGQGNREAHPRLYDLYDPSDLPMGMTAEKVAEQWEVSREEQDAYGAASQRRACNATDEGRFDDEIVPVDTGEELIEEDEGLRRGTTEEKLAQLPPVFTEDGTVTAGNASQISDGAASLLLTSRAFAEDYGLEIMAEVAHNNVAGVDPTIMGIGPVPAVGGLLERWDREITDYDLVELNEAFASQVIASKRELGIPDDRLNVNGGAIAIGHPLGCSGARLPVTLVHEMQKRDAELGVATMCVGMGQGGAVEFAR